MCHLLLDTELDARLEVVPPLGIYSTPDFPNHIIYH